MTYTVLRYDMIRMLVSAKKLRVSAMKLINLLHLAIFYSFFSLDISNTTLSLSSWVRCSAYLHDYAQFATKEWRFSILLA